MNARIARMVDDFERGRLTRRQLITHLTGFVAAVSAGGAVVAQEKRKSTFKATQINHVALRVSDVQRSRAFYEKHLGLTLMSDGGDQSCFLHCGRHDFLALFRREGPGLDHYCYTIDGYTASTAVETLESAGLEPRRRSNRVYFDDPDGIEVQVSAANSRRP